MTWLKNRLRELKITHQDLADRLAELGIVKSRPTVSNWVKGHPVPLLMSPRETDLLASALEWSVSEMLIAAEYRIIEQSIPMTIAPYLTQIESLNEKERETLRKTIEFGLGLIKEGVLDQNGTEG